MKKVIWIAVALGCLTNCINVSGPDLDRDDDGGIVYDSYAGLSIYGYLKIPNSTNPASPYAQGYEGKLDIRDVVGALGAICMNRSVENQGGVIGQYMSGGAPVGLKCYGEFLDDNVQINSNWINAPCFSRICSQDFYTCLGLQQAHIA